MAEDRAVDGYDELLISGCGARFEAVMPFVQEQLGAQVKGGGVAFGG
jgi:hypothetical protein